MNQYEPERKKTTKASKTDSKRNQKKENQENHKDHQISEKLNQYHRISIHTCIRCAQAMGIPYDYGQYMALLIQSSPEQIFLNLKKEYDLNMYSFEKDGYDIDLISVILNRIQNSMQEKFSFASNQHNIKEVIEEILKVCKRLNIHKIEEVNRNFKVNIMSLTQQYMKQANTWIQSIEDVKTYEKTLFSLLAQFKELYNEFDVNAILDVADFYILQNENKTGDCYYSYVIRDCQNKDEIYYRWACIYQKNDVDTSRMIAKKALRFVLNDSKYYSKLLDILL
ncbi:hypothetical protein [Floccifex sp.]|uniref:hypothetical protein n=1 Tax=Floccifex sp. TaxID=2815810 RepID=UPI003F090BD7